MHIGIDQQDSATQEQIIATNSFSLLAIGMVLPYQAFYAIYDLQLLLPVIFCFPILFGQTTDINDEIQRKVINAERISSSIKIDGILDEEAWSTSSVAENFV